MRSTVSCAKKLETVVVTFGVDTGYAGDVFRFKPDGILFNSPTAYRAIYQTKANVKKAKFYEIWPRNPHEINTLNTVDKATHARKRRVLNQAFSAEAIRSAETFVIRHVDRWNEILIDGNDGKEWTKPVNISEMIEYLVFDIMGDLCFGKTFDLKEPREVEFRHMPHTMYVPCIEEASIPSRSWGYLGDSILIYNDVDTRVLTLEQCRFHAIYVPGMMLTQSKAYNFLLKVFRSPNLPCSNYGCG